MKKTGLGRGLGALIEVEELSTSGSLSMGEIEIDKIEANPNQPRTVFDEETLSELAASIKELGIIQPVTLRKLSDDKYCIISGERRFRAAKLAGLTAIPAYVKDIDNNASIEMMALIENIQREDLNAIEIALGFRKLIEEFQLTQEQLAQKVGKQRSTITNYLGVLHLPATIQLALKEKKLSMGHAKALASINEPEMQLDVYRQILKDELSVRKAEELARLCNNPPEEKEETQATKEKAKKQNFKILETQFSSFFDTKVQIAADEKGKGKITIPFANEEDLERIMEIFDRFKSQS